MPISARNQLRGTIQQLVLGNVMAHVVVRVGENVIESVITRRSAEELNLKQGDTVTADPDKLAVCIGAAGPQARAGNHSGNHTGAAPANDELPVNPLYR